MQIKKFFTAEEANNTLPLVKQIVGDILESGLQMKSLVESIGNDIKKIRENEKVDQLSQEIRGFMKELEDIGCFYKDWDFSLGLVDFPALINGEKVFLCWRSDEEEVKFYHSMEEGYNGRKEIPKTLHYSTL